jgi:hypothetical protein
MSKPLVLLLAALSLGFVVPAGNGSAPAVLAEPSPSFDVMEVIGHVREGALAGGDPLVAESTDGNAYLISRAQDNQTDPDLAYSDEDDEWLAVWHDNRDGDFDIYGQRVDSEGTIRGEVIVVEDSDDDLLNPAVAYDSTQNRYFVVWQNNATDHIEGVVLSHTGTFVSSKVTMPSGAIVPVGERVEPDVAYNPVTDEYLVIWAYQKAAGNHDIQGCKVGVDGTVDPGGPFDISSLSGEEREPALIADPNDGRYLAVWRRLPADNYNIVGARLAQNGARIGNVFRISSLSATGNEFNPALALNPESGQILVVWEDDRADAGDIYGQTVNTDNSRGDPNADFQIAGGQGHQEDPSVAHDADDGGYLVTWDDGDDLFGQRLDDSADPTGGRFPISEAPNAQWFGAVAFGGDPYLVVWADHRSAGPDIFGQFVSQAGELEGDEIGLSPPYDSQQYPALAYGSVQQQWLVVWEDDHTGGRRLTGQFVALDGQLVGEPVAIGTNANGEYGPAVAYNSDDDEFMVVWYDWRNLNHDIYGQRVKASDGSLSAEVQVTSNPDWQWTPAIAYDGDVGQYLVVWSDRRNDPGDGTNWDIYGKRLKPDGTPWDGFALDVCKRQDNQEHPAVAYNADERQYLVAWDDSSLYGRGIAGQRIGDSSTWRVDLDNFDIYTSEDGHSHLHPSVACNATAGEYLVVSDAGGDIYGQRLAGDRNFLGSAFVISDAAGTQQYPRASYDPAHDRYYVCWADIRSPSTSWDIYGQYLSGSGGLLFTASDANVPVWTYTEMQEYPAAAQGPADEGGLVVWQDMRNGVSPKIYGRLEEPGELPTAGVYLPIVLRNQ